MLTRIQDLEQVLSQTKEQRNRFLNSVARNVRVWYIKVRKMASIYHTLNMFSVDLGQKCLIGEAWCPVSEIDRIQLALRRGTERAGGSGMWGGRKSLFRNHHKLLLHVGF